MKTVKAKVVDSLSCFYGLTLDVYKDGSVWRDVDDDETFVESELEFLDPKPKERKIEGYVTIDEFETSVIVFTELPVRDKRMGYFKRRKGDKSDIYQMDRKMFPDVKWEDEPRKVTITIVEE